MSDMLLFLQLVWVLSVLCGTDVCLGFIYDRPKRSGEDGASARTECEYTVLLTGKHKEHI